MKYPDHDTKKHYFRISDMEELLNVDRQTIYSWQKYFPVTMGGKLRGKRWVWTKGSIEGARKIKHLIRGRGLTVKAVQIELKEQFKAKEVVMDGENLIKKLGAELEKTRKEIKDIKIQLNRIENLLK
jgi:DNA-binding transcriptional MerR regulator